MHKDISITKTRAMLDLLVEQITQQMNEYTEKTGVIISNINVEIITTMSLDGNKQFRSYKLAASGDIFSNLT